MGSMTRHRILSAAVLSSLLVFGAEAQRVSAPKDVLMDEVIDLRVSGLRPGQRLTIRTSMPDSANRRWTASAEFIAGPRGDVVPARDSSIAGSYRGVSAMGL